MSSSRRHGCDRDARAQTPLLGAGALVTRTYHVRQLTLVSRKLRVIADTALSWLFRRAIAEMGYVELALRRAR
jgi:hypothetical protein